MACRQKIAVCVALLSKKEDMSFDWEESEICYGAAEQVVRSQRHITWNDKFYP